MLPLVMNELRHYLEFWKREIFFSVFIILCKTHPWLMGIETQALSNVNKTVSGLAMKTHLYLVTTDR